MAKKRKIHGYIVIEACEDYEQVLCLETGYENGPPGGVLDWLGEGDEHRTVFASRKDAREAIERTGHWAKAFKLDKRMPEPKLCKIVPVSFVGGGS